jgi:predicted metal-binding membrane protein
MTTSALEAVLRRDRLLIAGALGLTAALAWGYVLLLAADMDMGGMDMGGMDMGGMDMTGFRVIPAGLGLMVAPANAPWGVIEFAFVFVMWTVMMIGMMAPSVTPMILTYARVGRQGNVRGKPLAATGWFAAGYFLTWMGFALAATLVQWMIERAGLLDSQMASASNLLAGIVLIAVGVYQWSPLKDVCLTQCQSPIDFLTRYGGFRGDLPGCLLMGLRHGAYCIGCCWALMALLFVSGVMNVLWIAVLALVVLLEKLTPFGRWIAHAAGASCVGAGAAMLFFT